MCLIAAGSDVVVAGSDDVESQEEIWAVVTYRGWFIFFESPEER